MLSYVPATEGAGTPEATVADVKFSDVIGDVEYLKSYDEAVPVFPLSPGAVQLTVTEFSVAPNAAKSETATGGVVSDPLVVVTLGIFEMAETFAASSDTLRAK